jgi:NADPH-dependent 7-cyano-7-deazaguanine reductase QueF
MERRELLKSIKAPGPHRHEITCEELTFMGSPGQPDFARLIVTLLIKGQAKCPELKSVKEYTTSFRGAHMSYERILDTIWEDFNQVYRPEKICVEIEANIRGGISSRLWLGEEIE